jgi:hypothetical protein
MSHTKAVADDHSGHQPRQVQRAQLRLELAQLGTEVERTRADFEQWRLAAMGEMQLLQLGIDAVVEALRLEMRARYSELNK